MLSIAADLSPWSVFHGVIVALAALAGAGATWFVAIRGRKAASLDVICERRNRVVETFHDGLIVVNRDMRIVDANKQAKAMTGFADLIGRNLEELLPPDKIEVHRKHFAMYFDDPHPRRMGVAPMAITMVDYFRREKSMQISLTPSENAYTGGIEVTAGMQVLKL